MTVFHDLSIRHKLTLLLMGVVSVVLLAVSAANVVGEMRNTRSMLAAKYSTLAKIVATQSSAALTIADVDPSGAEQIVSDLEVEPSIRYAALMNATGKTIARYAPDESMQSPAPPSAPGPTFTDDGFLDVVEQARLADGTPVGKLYLRAATTELQVQVRRTAAIAVVVYVIAMAFAFLLSIALQRLISTPIFKLARLTERVSAEHDYSLMAVSRGNDELGQLCNRFNAMLAEIRRRDDELSHSNEELLRSNDELRQFAFVASHDLQEPLRSITSFCNLLREDCAGRLDEQTDDYIERIVGGAKRMKALVTDLLAYSRVQRDEQIALSKVDFSVVVADALTNLQVALNESGAEIIVGPMPTVVGDRVQLVQLVQNLVGNAIKYRSEQTPRIEIGARRVGQAWEFFVSDNGIGVAPEYRQQIFEIFKRLHGRDKYPGTGIGLAVCKKIVERHGGRISVDSPSGAGCVFRFTIQFQPNQPEEANDERHELAATRL